MGQDQEVAGRLTTAAGDVGTIGFTKAPTSNHGDIRLVGNQHKCTDDQDDIDRKIAAAAIGGFIIGGVGGAAGGPPGAIIGGLTVGASSAILAAIDEATTGGSRFSGCE
jgi:hypothetical protein